MNGPYARYLTATHEAGHCVAALFYGQEFSHVEIQDPAAPSDEVWAGRLVHSDGEGKSPPDIVGWEELSRQAIARASGRTEGFLRAAFEPSLICNLAGDAAVEVAGFRRSREESSDLWAARLDCKLRFSRIAAGRAVPAALIEAAVERARLEAKFLCSHAPIRGATDMIASELLRTNRVLYARARVIFDAWQRAIAEGLSFPPEFAPKPHRHSQACGQAYG